MGNSKGYKTVNIRPETYEKIPLLVEEYLKHHPELHGMDISHNHIINQVFDFYLDPRGRNR